MITLPHRNFCTYLGKRSCGSPLDASQSDGERQVRGFPSEAARLVGLDALTYPHARDAICVGSVHVRENLQARQGETGPLSSKYACFCAKASRDPLSFHWLARPFLQLANRAAFKCARVYQTRLARRRERGLMHVGKFQGIPLQAILLFTLLLLSSGPEIRPRKPSLPTAFATMARKATHSNLSTS